MSSLADVRTSGGLDKIARSDEKFSVATFLDGAKQAYEIIITAFAQGDRGAKDGHRFVTE